MRIEFWKDDGAELVARVDWPCIPRRGEAVTVVDDSGDLVFGVTVNVEYEGTKDGVRVHVTLDPQPG